MCIRMLGKYTLCFVFAAVGFVMTVSGSDRSDIRNPNDEVYSEKPCLNKGGICVRAYDCPEHARITTKGLCPAQQKNGVECCYSLPKSETRCGKRGGQCRSKLDRCPENLTFKRATDCAPDETCCILV